MSTCKSENRVIVESRNGGALRWKVALPAGILLLHIFLVGSGAVVHAPVLDETGHLPAGLAILRSGRFDIYPQNPPLVKTIAALPCLLYTSPSPRDQRGSRMPSSA